MAWFNPFSWFAKEEPAPLVPTLKVVKVLSRHDPEWKLPGLRPAPPPPPPPPARVIREDRPGPLTAQRAAEHERRRMDDISVRERAAEAERRRRDEDTPLYLATGLLTSSEPTPPTWHSAPPAYAGGGGSFDGGGSSGDWSSSSDSGSSSSDSGSSSSD